MKRSLLSSFSDALLFGITICLLWVPCRQSVAAAENTPVEKKIERWVRDLGSSSFEEREAATRALKEIEEAEPALRKLLESNDPEVRRRSADILKALKHKRGGWVLAPALALAERGRAVEMADRLVHCAESDRSGERWNAVMRLSKKVIDSVPPEPRDLQKRFRAISGVGADGRAWLPAGDFRLYVEACTLKPREISGRDVLLQTLNFHTLVRAERVSWKRKGPSCSIVVASGDVHTRYARFSIIIAGGNVEMMDLGESIVICDGDVKVTGVAKTCVIIARGKIVSSDRDTIHRDRIVDSVIRSDGFFRISDRKPVAITEKTPDPFAFVKFFELADVGLAATDRDERHKPIRDGVFLTEVRKKSPFVAGLRAGDVITAIEGKKTASVEDFRRLLRRKLAEAQLTLTFTVRRRAKTMDVEIPMKD